MILCVGWAPWTVTVIAFHHGRKLPTRAPNRSDTPRAVMVQLIVWRRLGSLRDPEKLRPWLVSVAANLHWHVGVLYFHLVPQFLPDIILLSYSSESSS